MAFPDWDGEEKLAKEEALEVRERAEIVGDGCHEKDCFWRGYRLGDRCFLGLNDGLDIWEVDEKTMLDHCEDE